MADNLGYLIRLSAIGLTFAVFGTHTLTAQSTTPTGGTVPSADPADVSSIASIMVALYDVISGPAGEPRDWDRLRSLFDPNARMISTSPAPEGSGFRARTLTVDNYVESASSAFTENGFFEIESSRVEDVFENIAQVFSTYETRRTPDGPVFMRGINSIQLAWDGERWWIMNIMWRGVGPDYEFSVKYLPRR